MKRYGHLFEKICSMKNIEQAHKNASKGKSHYSEVMDINANPKYYFKLIQDMLINNTFENSDYSTFIKNDRGKERVIYKLPYFPDRIIHHAIMQVLEPIWKTVLIKDTFQSIKGRGVSSARKRVMYTMKTFKPKYCLKLDIKKFYPSINNTILKSIVSIKIKCRRTLNLLYKIIDSIQGVPIGNYLSQYFGNLYLAYFDHFIKEFLKIKHYFRYCDDIVIMHNSKAILHKTLEIIKDYLKALTLELKSNYQIFPLENRGVDFVGYRFFYKYTLTRKSISTKFKRSGRKLLSNVSVTSLSSMFSYYGWAVHCDGYNLIKAVFNSKLVNVLQANNIKHKLIGA